MSRIVTPRRDLILPNRHKQRGFIINPHVFGASGGGGGSDPYWADVAALLHLNGTNGSKVYTDEKGGTWSPSAASSIATAQSKFGGASGIDTYIARAYSSAFSFGTGDFTVEFWHRWVSTSAGFQTAYNHGYNGAGGLVMQTVGGGSGVDARRFHVVVNGSILFTEATAPSALTWTFYRLKRASGVVSLERDGAVTGSGSSSANLNNTDAIAFGARHTVSPGQYPLEGYTDDLRVTKGVARTDGVPTAAFPNS